MLGIDVLFLVILGAATVIAVLILKESLIKNKSLTLVITS